MGRGVKTDVRIGGRRAAVGVLGGKGDGGERLGESARGGRSCDGWMERWTETMDCQHAWAAWEPSLSHTVRRWLEILSVCLHLGLYIGMRRLCFRQSCDVFCSPDSECKFSSSLFAAGAA